MEESSVGYEVRSGTVSKSVAFDFSEFEELPDANASRAMVFSDAMDAALLKFWPVKRHSDVARLLRVSENTARKRYRELCQK